jgi:hypothetical protein
MFLTAFVLIGISTDARADQLDASQTAALIAGKTWSGVNAEGNRFSFYHDEDGTFRARFSSTSSGSKVYRGRWSTRGSSLCWAWDGWQTFCYHRFEQHGPELTMTRDDQVVHTGNLVEGNPGGL